MELLVQVLAAPVIGVTPFLIGLLLCCYCTSWRRWLAVVFASISGSIFLFEVYSASVGGNLTGLIWMLSLPIISVATFILYLSENLFKRLKNSENSDSIQSGNETVPQNTLDAKSSMDHA